MSFTGQEENFSRKRFFRGIVLPPGGPVTGSGRIKDETGFPGDVILKGVNALNLPKGQTGIYIGDLHGGTIGASIQTVVGRRVRLILPVRLEKCLR